MKYIGARSIKESFDNLPSGVCFADSRGMIVLCNRQMHRLCHILLGTGLQHIFEFREALSAPRDGVSFVSGESDVFQFPDGEVWEFRESRVTDADGKSYTQVQALSLTELYAKKTELERKNRELEEVNERARRLYETLDKTVREEEAFAIKMRVHNDIGLRLLSTRNVLREGGLSDIQKAGEMWQTTLNVLGAIDNASSDKDTSFEHETADKTEEMLRELLASAAGIGVNIVIDGEFPRNAEQAYLLISAMRECAVNTARHAGGSEMSVGLIQTKNALAVRIENDGRSPETEIAEGGGLSDLRRRIEKAGGTMTIQSRPKFKLTLNLPRKDK
ncbi:MAG TPA: hypothetical protein PLO47_03110 [Bacillota bacterium]|mgnify:CR=1 FL=1|nr:hypothetical protein [Bacillota bacterium]